MPSAGSKPFHFSAAPIDQVQSVELNTGHAALCMAGNRLDQNAKEREIGGFAVAKCIANQF